MCIRYRGNFSTKPFPSNDMGIFTDPLPSNDKGDTQTHTHTQQHDFMSLLNFLAYFPYFGKIK
jgi:hypothetical protein